MTDLQTDLQTENMTPAQDPETGVVYGGPRTGNPPGAPRPVADKLAGKLADKMADTADTRKPPDPRRVPLPCGGQLLMYTRENLAYILKCSHGELGRLLRARLAPLPIRVDGQILWFCDEVLNSHSTVERTLARWRR